MQKFNRRHVFSLTGVAAAAAGGVLIGSPSASAQSANLVVIPEATVDGWENSYFTGETALITGYVSKQGTQHGAWWDCDDFGDSYGLMTVYGLTTVIAGLPEVDYKYAYLMDKSDGHMLVGNDSAQVALDNRIIATSSIFPVRVNTAIVSSNGTPIGAIDLYAEINQPSGDTLQRVVKASTFEQVNELVDALGSDVNVLIGIQRSTRAVVGAKLGTGGVPQTNEEAQKITSATEIPGGKMLKIVDLFRNVQITGKKPPIAQFARARQAYGAVKLSYVPR